MEGCAYGLFKEHGLLRPRETKFVSLDEMQRVAEMENIFRREPSKGRFKRTTDPVNFYSLNICPIRQAAYAKVLHPVALRKLEDWQVTGGTYEQKALFVSTFNSLLDLQTSLPKYDASTVPEGIEPNDRLYLDSYWRRIRSNPLSGAKLPETPASSTLAERRPPATDTVEPRHLRSHLYLPVLNATSRVTAATVAGKQKPRVSVRDLPGRPLTHQNVVLIRRVVEVYFDVNSYAFDSSRQRGEEGYITAKEHMKGDTFKTTYQEMMKPPPPGLGIICKPARDEEVEKLKKTLISPILVSEKISRPM